MSSSADDRLAALIEDSSTALGRLAGGAAVCTFTRAGVAVPSIKHAEGRWAALREVHRRSRDGADPGQVAVEALGVWRDHLEAMRSRAAGPDWIAYRAGGIDALEELVAGEADV